MASPNADPKTGTLSVPSAEPKPYQVEPAQTQPIPPWMDFSPSQFGVPSLSSLPSLPSLPSIPTIAAVGKTVRRRPAWRGLALATTVSTMTFAIVVALALAPLLALGAAAWAAITGLIDLWSLYNLARKSQILVLLDPHALSLLNSLETVERVGFLAIAYLALIFALITLMGGLLGRRWGRLYILPGAIFTVTAIAALLLGLLFAAPLFTSSFLGKGWLIGLTIYALLDAPLLSAALVDTRITRSPTATGSHRVVRLERKERKPFHYIRNSWAALPEWAKRSTPLERIKASITRPHKS